MVINDISQITKEKRACLGGSGPYVILESISKTSSTSGLAMVKM